MPNRLIRDAIKASDRVNALSVETQNFYWRMLLSVDDYGRFDARVSAMTSAAWPAHFHRHDPDKVEAMLAEISNAGLATVYEVGGKRFVELSPFYNRVRAKSSRYPAPSEADRITYPDRSMPLLSAESSSQTIPQRVMDHSSDVDESRRSAASLFGGREPPADTRPMSGTPTVFLPARAYASEAVGESVREAVLRFLGESRGPEWIAGSVWMKVQECCQLTSQDLVIAGLNSAADENERAGRTVVPLGNVLAKVKTRVGGAAFNEAKGEKPAIKPVEAF